MLIHVRCSLAICETLAALNFGVVWLFHIHVLRFTKICDGSLLFPLIFFLCFGFLWCSPFSLLSLLPKQTQAHRLWWTVLWFESSPTKNGRIYEKKTSASKQKKSLLHHIAWCYPCCRKYCACACCSAMCMLVLNLAFCNYKCPSHRVTSAKSKTNQVTRSKIKKSRLSHLRFQR